MRPELPSLGSTTHNTINLINFEMESLQNKNWIVPDQQIQIYNRPSERWLNGQSRGMKRQTANRIRDHGQRQ